VTVGALPPVPGVNELVGDPKLGVDADFESLLGVSADPTLLSFEGAASVEGVRVSDESDEVGVTTGVEESVVVVELSLVTDVSTGVSVASCANTGATGIKLSVISRKNAVILSHLFSFEDFV